MNGTRVLALVGLVLVGTGIAAALWYFPPYGQKTPPEATAAAPAVRTELPGTQKPLPEVEIELPPGIDIHFEDVTDQAGIHFQHVDGRTPQENIRDTTGSGVGWLDYDQDGLMDLFLVQGSTFDYNGTDAIPTSRLYKNLGGGKFRDVTEEVGLGHRGCGQGVAIGDIDNDGYPDLFLTCYGKPNVLYHNVSDGKGGRRFVDCTAAAGLADNPDWFTRPNYSTSAAFLDYDNDGHLDLFVCSYIHIDMAHYPLCFNGKGSHGPCPPTKFKPTRCVLYHNNGNNTFTDVSHEAGIDLPAAKALGVVALDLDGDGTTDLFVANDGVPNFLFLNRGHGHFEAAGPESGCSVNLAGTPQAYMGVDADDLNGDGRPDLFVTAFSRETNTFFRNEGGGQFLDVTIGSGLGPASWFQLGFGTCFLDVDHDGSQDIVVVNGHVARFVDELGDPNETFRQKAQLYLNDGRGLFQDVSSRSGGYFQQPRVGRGLACCDYDNDGQMDLAINNSGETAVLLHNQSKTPYHWVRLELRGTTSNRDAVGAQVTLKAGGQTMVRHRKGGGSYLSACDPRLLVGLGSARTVDEIDIRWPSGLVQHLGPLAADHGYLLTEGSDKVTGRP